MARHPVFTDALLDAALHGGPPPARWFHPTALEVLCRAPWWSPYAIGLPTGIWLAVTAPVSWNAVPRLIVGILTWTLIEYLLHRFVFHLPVRGPVTAVVTYTIHRHHHHAPQQTHRLVATPAQAGSLLVPLGTLFLLTDPLGAWTSLGLLLGWLGYEMLHAAIHHRHHLPGCLARLRAHHLHHHEADSSSNFGISSPLWDVVFATRSRPGGPQKQGHPVSAR